MPTHDVIALSTVALNVIILIITSVTSNKIANLRAEIFQTFLTKDDFYAHQKMIANHGKEN